MYKRQTFVNPADLNKDDSTKIDFTGKVQHAILTFNPNPLKLGFVTRGTPVSGFVQVIDSGDAPFVLKSTSFGPPITGLVLNGKALQPGDTIKRGDTVNIEIDGQLDTFIDTTVSYTLFSNKPCDDFTGQMQIATSSLKVTATSYPCLLYTSPSPRD